MVGRPVPSRCRWYDERIQRLSDAGFYLFIIDATEATSTFLTYIIFFTIALMIYTHAPTIQEG